MHISSTAHDERVSSNGASEAEELYLPGPKVAARYDVSDMTLYRWIRHLRRHFLSCRSQDASERDIALVDAEIGKGFVFLLRKRNTVLDLERLLNRIEFAVRVYGVRVVAIDPVNEVDHQVPKGESKTDYMGRLIMKLKQLADDYNLLVICCAHPPKDGVEKRLSRCGLLTLNDGADTAHWGTSLTLAGACGATLMDRPICISTS